MIVMLLTEHHMEFLSLTGCCGGSAESTLVKMSNCWKSQSMAQITWGSRYFFISFSHQRISQAVLLHLRTLLPSEGVHTRISLLNYQGDMGPPLDLLMDHE